MSDLDLPNAQRIVTLLSSAIKGLRLYPAGHPALDAPVRDLFRLLTESFVHAPEIRLGLIDGVLFLDRHLFVTPNSATNELTDQFTQKKISCLSFHCGLDSDELSRFIPLLGEKYEEPGDFGEMLSTAGITHIQALNVDGGDERTGDTTSTTPRQTYQQALHAIREIFSDIERGRIPNSDAINAMVDNMVDMTINDPPVLLALTLIKDYDNYTFNHSVNVGILAMALGSSMGLSREKLRELGTAGFLHDIGKTRIDKDILNKPGKLTSLEYEKMKKHSEDGVKIIKGMAGVSANVAQAVLGHHIRYNRQGYPEWAQNLPFGKLCDIISVADCYDAITTLRAYSAPISPKSALDELHKLSGTILDGNLVSSFIAMMGKYPVGTLVRLDSNEIAVVIRPNPLAEDKPVIKIVIGPAGESFAIPRLVDLGACSESTGARIVAIVDPLLKNIDVAAFLD